MLELLLMAMPSREDENKFNKIYDKYKNLVFYICGQYLKNESDIEDAAFDALFKVALNINNIKDVSSDITKGYISAITKNTCIDLLMKGNKMKEISIDDVNEIAFSLNDVEEKVEGSIMLEVYKECLIQLSDLQYQVLYMKYVQGLSVKEISKVFNVSENTVSQRIFVAKKNFLKLIKESLDHEPATVS